MLRILQSKSFSTAATKYGIDNEAVALQAYQKTHAHPNLMVTSSGFIVSISDPFLGASPDGAVYDPESQEQPFGFLEIKCPFSFRNKTPEEASSMADFCCTFNSLTEQLQLKKSHHYFSQVQGQMGISSRPWCDFVVYTQQGISVERIPFDVTFWEQTLLPKLVRFYDCCVLPEIVSPVHTVGLPIRDFRSMTTP